MNSKKLVMILGGGETASCISYYLWKSNFSIAMVLSESEVHLRRPICFGEAGRTGKKQISGATALLVKASDISGFNGNSLPQQWKKAIQFQINDHTIPVFFAEEFPDFLEILEPAVIINTLPENITNVSIESASLVISMYPFHHPGKDCNISIETRLNYWLGSVYQATPPDLPVFDVHFFKKSFDDIYAPIEGIFIAIKNIGEVIDINEAIGTINDIEIRSPYRGQIWGLLHSGQIIRPKQHLAIIYQGKSERKFKSFNFQHRTIAGSVLKEILSFYGSML